MTRHQALAVFVSVLVAGACASCARSENELLDRPGGRIRVAYTSTPDLNDVPSLMAHKRLGDRGYSVDTVFFAQPELAAQALGRGDVDIAIGSTRTFWASALAGAPVVAVMEASRNDHLLVARTPIQSCAELAGRRVASHSSGSVGYALLRAYVAEQCPGTEPVFLQMPGSSSRVSALLAGTIDAAVVQHDDLLRTGVLQGQTVVLEAFAKRWPAVATTGVFVRTAFAQANPGAVEDYLRECLSIIRHTARDPSQLVAEAQTILETSDDLRPVVQTYLADQAWDPEGGLSPEVVAQTFEFFVRTGSLPADRSPSTLVDRTFLDRALSALAAEERR